MALINCPECGREVSSRAKVCIHCGYPIEELVCENVPDVQEEILNCDQEFKLKNKEEVSAEVWDKLIGFSVILEKMKDKLKQTFLNVRREKKAGWLVEGPELVCRKLEESYEDINDYLKNHKINGALEKEVFLDVDINHIEVLKNIMLFEHENTINRLNSIVEQKAQDAYNREADNYNGLGFGIISNSLIDHLLYIGMEASELKKAEKKAQEAADAVRNNSDVISNAGKITEQNYYIPFENEVLMMIESFYSDIEKRIYISNNTEYISEDIKVIVGSIIEAFNKRVPEWENRMAAIRNMEVLMRIEPNIEIGDEGYSHGYVAAGNVYAQLKDLDRTYECYKKAVVVDPVNRLALNNMGNFFSKAETKYFNAELAIKYLSRSDLPAAYHNLASIYNPKFREDGFEKYKDADKAMKLYKIALSKGYNESSTYNNLGVLYGDVKGDILRAAVYCHIAATMGNSMGASNFNNYSELITKKYGKRTVEQLKTIKSLNEGEQFINKVLSRKFKWF